MLFFNFRKVLEVKKLIYYFLICAIMVSHSKISRAIDEDPDELNQKIVCKTSAVGVIEEGEHGGKLYIKQSRLRKIIFSPPGEYETEEFEDPYLNGFKCVTLKNGEGKEETYLLHSLHSFSNQKHISRFSNDDQLVSFPLTSFTPGIPAWGVEVRVPIKKKPS